MIEWIIGIGGLVLGILGKGFWQFLVTRRDEHRKDYNNNLIEIVKKLSEYGAQLNNSFNIWHNDCKIVLNKIDEYIISSKQSTENIDFLKEQYADVISCEEKYICKFANICRNRLISETNNNEINDYVIKAQGILSKLSIQQNELKQCILSMLIKIENETLGFLDIINTFPEIYKIPFKPRKKIQTAFLKIQMCNNILNRRISQIKEDPISNICTNDKYIGNLIYDIIVEVGLAKEIIASNIKT